MILGRFIFLTNKKYEIRLKRRRDTLAYSEMVSHSPLQEIRNAAQEVQRVLGSLSFPSGKEVIVEPVVIEEGEMTCKPCPCIHHGQEKPEWAIHGCSGNGHRNKVIRTTTSSFGETSDKTMGIKNSSEREWVFVHSPQVSTV